MKTKNFFTQYFTANMYAQYAHNKYPVRLINIVKLYVLNLSTFILMVKFVSFRFRLVAAHIKCGVRCTTVEPLRYLVWHTHTLQLHVKLSVLLECSTHTEKQTHSLHEALINFPLFEKNISFN